MVALRKNHAKNPPASVLDNSACAGKSSHDASVRGRDASREARIKRQIETAKRIMERDKDILAALAK